jgi:hypothetical protein
MESVRKMVLVPENEMLQKLQLAQAAPEAKEQVTTKVEMQQMLMDQDESVPVDLRAKLFTEMMHKYMALQRAARPISKPAVGFMPHVAAPPLAAPAAPQEQLTAGEISAMVPRTVTNKAKQLATFLRTRSGLTWDGAGTITIDGRAVANTNIVDLVRYAVLPKAGKTKPLGWNQFGRLLSQSNVPTTLAPRLLQQRLEAAVVPHIDGEDAFYDAAEAGPSVRPPEPPKKYPLRARIGRNKGPWAHFR